jgi:hypothetical protein
MGQQPSLDLDELLAESGGLVVGRGLMAPLSGG